MRIISISTVFTLAMGVSSASAQFTPKPYDPPEATTWAPEGCRTVPWSDPALPERSYFSNLHAGPVNTDEISTAIAPMAELTWIAEPDQYHITGPVFDREGNLYAPPFQAYDGSILISLDPRDGSRRWSIQGNGSPAGIGAPMVLDDPDEPGEQIVYLGLYDRAIAVQTDGTIVWDVPTGLTLGTDLFDNLTPGTNYHPPADAILTLSIDGHLYALDRETGAQLLDAPFALPGERTPSQPPILPPPLFALADVKFAQLADVGPGDFERYINVLLGNNTEVGNMFSIDPNSGRIWIAATAPDEADGTVDGISEFGAVYGFDLETTTSGYEVVTACSRFFAGGSASTPALSTDGSRVYFGDNFGKLIAIDSDCNDVWEYDVGRQIIGSVAISSDNGEVIASTQSNIQQIFDRGSSAEAGWTSLVDAFDFGPATPTPPFQNLQLLLVTVGANSLSFNSGAGLISPAGTRLPYVVGVGNMDRETGAIRSFAVGREETVGVMNTAPDGSTYHGHSPTRRLILDVLATVGQAPPGAPLIGGIGKYGAIRLDLLVRDVTCAAEARAQNAFDNRMVCPDSANADTVQLGSLIEQARLVAPQAIEDEDLSADDWATIDKELKMAETKLATGKLQHLRPAANAFRRACAVLE